MAEDQSADHVALSADRSVIIPGARRLPDFLHIGPSKAGSTWIFKALTWHPQIYTYAGKNLDFARYCAAFCLEKKVTARIIKNLSRQLKASVTDRRNAKRSAITHFRTEVKFRHAYLHGGDREEKDPH